MDVLFYPRKNDATNASGRCSIYCSITINSLRCVPFSTNIKVIAKNWNSKKKTTTDEFSDTIRQEILRIENTLRRIKINLEENNQPITAEIIKFNYLKLKKEQTQRKTKTEKITLESIYSIITAQKMSLGATKSTDRHDYFLAKTFLDFAEKQGFKAITPTQVSIDLVEDFIYNFKRSKNYLRQSLALLQKSLSYAMRKGLISTNIVKDYIDKPKGNDKKTDEIGLELEEVQALKNYKPENLAEEKAIDIFLFMCGTSLDFCDYNRMKNKHIDQIANTKIITIDRKKTDRYDTTTVCEHNAIIKDLAIEILKKYGSIENLPRFNDSSNLGKTLKLIATKVGIDKNLTTKRARKTFANLSINYEMQTDEQTAYQMGHVDTSQLRNYRRYNHKILDNLIK